VLGTVPDYTLPAHKDEAKEVDYIFIVCPATSAVSSLLLGTTFAVPSCALAVEQLQFCSPQCMSTGASMNEIMLKLILLLVRLKAG